MIVTVYINTGMADGIVVIEGKDLPDIFSKIPHVAANKGLALTNDGRMVTYKVMVQGG